MSQEQKGPERDVGPGGGGRSPPEPGETGAPPPPARSREEWKPANEADAAERDAAAKAEAFQRALRNVRTWKCPEDCPTCVVTGVTYSKSSHAVQICGGASVGNATIQWYCSVVLICESQL